MGDYGFSLHPYFKEMPSIGKPLTRQAKANVEELKKSKKRWRRRLQESKIPAKLPKI